MWRIGEWTSAGRTMTGVELDGSSPDSSNGSTGGGGRTSQLHVSDDTERRR